jgi:predicted Zn-dependent protease
MAKAARATQSAPYNASYRELAAAPAIKAKDYKVAERHIRALIALEPDRPLHQQRLEALLKMAK